MALKSYYEMIHERDRCRQELAEEMDRQRRHLDKVILARRIFCYVFLAASALMVLDKGFGMKVGFLEKPKKRIASLMSFTGQMEKQMKSMNPSALQTQTKASPAPATNAPVTEVAGGNPGEDDDFQELIANQENTRAQIEKLQKMGLGQGVQNSAGTKIAAPQSPGEIPPASKPVNSASAPVGETPVAPGTRPVAIPVSTPARTGQASQNYSENGIPSYLREYFFDLGTGLAPGPGDYSVANSNQLTRTDEGGGSRAPSSQNGNYRAALSGDLQRIPDEPSVPNAGYAPLLSLPARYAGQEI